MTICHCSLAGTEVCGTCKNQGKQTIDLSQFQMDVSSALLLADIDVRMQNIEKLLEELRSSIIK